MYILFASILLSGSLSATEQSLSSKIVGATKKAIQSDVKIIETKSDGIEYILQSVDTYEGFKAYNFKLKPNGIMNFFNKATIDISPLMSEASECNSVLKPICEHEQIVSTTLTSENINDEPNLIIVVVDFYTTKIH